MTTHLVARPRACWDEVTELRTKAMEQGPGGSWIGLARAHGRHVRGTRKRQAPALQSPVRSWTDEQGKEQIDWFAARLWRSSLKLCPVCGQRHSRPLPGGVRPSTKGSRTGSEESPTAGKVSESASSSGKRSQTNQITGFNFSQELLYALTWDIF